MYYWWSSDLSFLDGSWKTSRLTAAAPLAPERLKDHGSDPPVRGRAGPGVCSKHFEAILCARLYAKGFPGLSYSIILMDAPQGRRQD